MAESNEILRDVSDSETSSSCSSASEMDYFEDEDGLDTTDRFVEPNGHGIQPYQFEPDDSSDPDTTETEDEHADGDDRVLNTDWCTCGYCQIMPTHRECICCKSLDKTVQKCEEEDPVPVCITQHPNFEAVCLNRGVLDTAYYQYAQQYGARAAAPKRPDERYRHIAYRQLVRWCWQFLGKDNRRVLPACAVIKIQSTFPAPDGNYCGFQR